MRIVGNGVVYVRMSIADESWEKRWTDRLCQQTNVEKTSVDLDA